MSIEIRRVEKGIAHKLKFVVYYPSVPVCYEVRAVNLDRRDFFYFGNCDIFSCKMRNSSERTGMFAQHLHFFEHKHHEVVLKCSH